MERAIGQHATFCVVTAQEIAITTPLFRERKYERIPGAKYSAIPHERSNVSF